MPYFIPLSLVFPSIENFSLNFLKIVCFYKSTEQNKFKYYINLKYYIT